MCAERSTAELKEIVRAPLRYTAVAIFVCCKRKTAGKAVSLLSDCWWHGNQATRRAMLPLNRRTVHLPPHELTAQFIRALTNRNASCELVLDWPIDLDLLPNIFVKSGNAFV